MLPRVEPVVRGGAPGGAARAARTPTAGAARRCAGAWTAPRPSWTSTGCAPTARARRPRGSTGRRWRAAARCSSAGSRPTATRRRWWCWTPPSRRRRSRWTWRSGRRRRCACTWRGGAAARCCCRASAGRPFVAPDLAGWPAAHARLALVEGRRAAPAAGARPPGRGGDLGERPRGRSPRPGPRRRRRRLAGHAASRAPARAGLHGRGLCRPAPGPRGPRDARPRAAVGGGGVSAAATGISWGAMRDRAQAAGVAGRGPAPGGLRCAGGLRRSALGLRAGRARRRSTARPPWWSSPRRSARRWWRSAAPACRARSCTWRRWPRWRRSARAALVAMGLPARQLLPGAWSELAADLDRGLAGIRTVEWPYAGDDEWVAARHPARRSAAGGRWRRRWRSGRCAGAAGRCWRWRSWRSWPPTESR